MEFRLLGPLEVLDGDRPLSLGGPKQRSLLAILLLHAGRVVPTERMIDELWGAAPPATVAKSVQVYVSRLRKQIGDDRLLTRAPGYLLQIDSQELDLARFERLVAEAKGAPAPAAAEKLGEALALWRGPPFADLTYEPFAQAPIARLEELRLAALEQRIDAMLATGRHAELVSDLEALVTEHPAREVLRGQLMLSLYRSGRQTDALQAYQSARTALVDELGIEPGRPLRELHQAILQQDPGLDRAVAPEPLAATPHGGFVGREDELAALLAGLDDAFAGRGRLFLLEGEPGIGKSRLAEELSARARARGARVLVGRCWEVGGAPAYWPWVQSLRTYISDSDSVALRSQLGAGAADLAQIVPELRERFPDLPEPPALEPQAARFRLFDAAAGFLRNASQGRPIVLVLDDLHAADTPSLLLLRFLARELGSTRVLLIGAYRDIDPLPAQPLMEAVAAVTREPIGRRLPLSGLSEHEVAAFVELNTSTTGAPALVTALSDEAEGNPLFVGEIARLLLVEPVLLEATRGVRLPIPQSIRDVMARRLTHLSDECNRVLGVASVLGHEFALDALARVGGVPEEQLLETVDEATAARVVADVPGDPGRLRFAHALMRDTVYEGLTGTRRVRLHRRAVTALEALYVDEPGPHLVELGQHCVAGREFDEGARYARRAGDRALTLLAYEEAARLYESALDTLELTRRVDPAARAELLLAIGDAHARAGGMDEARQMFLAAAELARSSRLPEHLAHAALGYGGRFVWQRAWDDRRLVPLLQEALTALGENASLLRARLLARLAGALRDQPSLEPRASLSREAVEIARRLGDTDTLAYALVGHFMATWGPDVDELVAIADEVTRLVEETGLVERTLEAVTLQSIIAWLTLADGDTTAAVDTEYEALADKLKEPAHQWAAAMLSVAWALLQGRLAEAEQLAEAALRSGDPPSPDARCSYRLAMFVLRREQGRLRDVEDLTRAAIAEYPGYRSFRCLVALLDCELEREHEARRAFDELAVRDFAALPRDSEWLFCLSILAEVAAYLEDRDRAAVLYRLLLPYARLNTLVSGEVAIGAVARYLGILATTTVQWAQAAGHFEEAMAMNARMGAHPTLAHTQHDYARMLLARDGPGDREHAQALVDAARETYRQLGMDTYVARISALPQDGRSG